MKYITVDAAIEGTGIRDTHESVYIQPEDLGLSKNTQQLIGEWLTKYKHEHMNGFYNNIEIEALDIEGKEIALMIKNELQDVKVLYYSDGTGNKYMI